MSTSQKFFLVLFLAVSLLWIGYQAFLLPHLANRRAEADFAQAVGECHNNYRASADVDEAAEQACMVRANGLYVIRRTAISQRYSPQGLLALLLVCLGFPATLYALLIGSLSLVRLTIRRTVSGPASMPPLRNLHT